MKLQEQVAIVTGGGQGIGRAISLNLAKEGANVVIYDRNPETARSVADEIKALGQRALSIKCDVSNTKEIIESTNRVLDAFKRIDILVNGAGIGETAPAEEVTEAMWDKVMNINLKGLFFCTQTIGKQMIKQKSGNIINITSTAAHVAAPLQATYSTSKGGVLALTRVLAVEWAKYNIRVNAVSPSLTKTPFIMGSSKEVPNSLKDRWQRIPSKRFNEPEDIANAVLFLASPESANIVGQAIIVDGGTTALLSCYIWREEQRE